MLLHASYIPHFCTSGGSIQRFPALNIRITHDPYNAVLQPSSHAVYCMTVLLPVLLRCFMDLATKWVGLVPIEPTRQHKFLTRLSTLENASPGLLQVLA